MMFIAVATMMFVAASCTKDKDDYVKAGNNEIVIDGTVYKFSSMLQYEESGRHYVDAYQEGSSIEETAYTFRADAEPETFNKSFDLKQRTEGVDYAFSFVYENVLSFSLDNHVEGEPQFGGWLNENEYDGSSCFAEGTLTISKDSEAFTYCIDGTLKNNQKVSLKIYVPASSWEALEW